jgi:hypothetical protein
MEKNIATQGRVIRFILGILLLVIAILYDSWIAYLLAAFVFFEVYHGWCAINWLFGKNECSTK